MVLCMRLETTSPTTILRRPACSGWSDCVACALVSAILLFLRSARGGQFALAGDRLDSRNVPAQAANFFQAFSLSHVELELKLEELVAEIALLRDQFVSRQISYFVRFHIGSAFVSSAFKVPNALSSESLRASRTQSAKAACAKPDASPRSHRSARPLPFRTGSCLAVQLQPNDRERLCLFPYGFRLASWSPVCPEKDGSGSCRRA